MINPIPSKNEECRQRPLTVLLHAFRLQQLSQKKLIIQYVYSNEIFFATDLTIKRWLHAVIACEIKVAVIGEGRCCLYFMSEASNWSCKSWRYEKSDEYALSQVMWSANVVWSIWYVFTCLKSKLKPEWHVMIMYSVCVVYLYTSGNIRCINLITLIAIVLTVFWYVTICLK